MSERIIDAALVALVVAATVLALVLAGTLVVLAHDKLSDPAPVCQEDEACWDCRTMGNRICGPGAPHPAGHY